MKLRQNFKKFFQDKNGEWAIFQRPNVVFLVWVALLVVNLVVVSEELQLMQKMALVVWAYLELAQGDSYFRRLLGAVVLTTVVIGIFVQQ